MLNFNYFRHVDVLTALIVSKYRTKTFKHLNRKKTKIYDVWSENVSIYYCIAVDL